MHEALMHGLIAFLRGRIIGKRGTMKRKRRSLKWSMLNTIITSWLLPIIVITLIISVFVEARLSEQMNRTVSTTMEKAAEICNLRLNDCITQSKEISYNSQLRVIYQRWKETGNRADLYADVSVLLEEKYKFNQDYLMTGLYFTEDPDTVYFTGNQSLRSSRNYFDKVSKKHILEEAESIDTRTVLVADGMHVYLVRNIMDRSFQPYAVLFMDLNRDRIFESLRAVWQYESFAVYSNDTLLAAAKEAEETMPSDLIQDGQVHVRNWNEVYISSDIADHPIVYIVKFDRNAVAEESRTPLVLFAMLLLFLIPLIIRMFRFFQKRVQEPVEELAAASQEIQNGKYGVVVKVHENNGEITDLDQNFNAMSRQLKDAFERIYGEEIALRDANIHALQSQINPHFLNNTLEIINWEARMAGNDKVSEMIEALSTMMSATADRDRKPLIPLSEEMSYVDAYLYIIQCRFGDAFTCTISVPEEIGNYLVPRLIIQPVIENAVEHGRDESGRGRVSLTIEGGENEQADLLITILNKGEPSKEDMEKIRILLSDDDTELTHASHIGIRNVNRRLKMIYGEESGLTIGPDGHGNTRSAIFIKK